MLHLEDSLDEARLRVLGRLRDPLEQSPSVEGRRGDQLPPWRPNDLGLDVNCPPSDVDRGETAGRPRRGGLRRRPPGGSSDTGQLPELDSL